MQDQQDLGKCLVELVELAGLEWRGLLVILVLPALNQQESVKCLDQLVGRVELVGLEWLAHLVALEGSESQDQQAKCLVGLVEKVG